MPDMLLHLKHWPPYGCRQQRITEVGLVPHQVLVIGARIGTGVFVKDRFRNVNDVIRY